MVAESKRGKIVRKYGSKQHVQQTANLQRVEVKVEYIEALDALGKYRFITPAAKAVGQFDHANTLEEIRIAVAKAYAPVITLMDITEED
jgi:hypothetical protein